MAQINIFDRLALEKDDDYWKTGPGYEVPKYPKGLANLYGPNPRHFLAGPNKVGAPKPIQYMNAKAPYEQGPSQDSQNKFNNAKEKSKAKQVISQTFDLNGQTDVQERVDENGTKTTTTVKKSAEVIDDEQQQKLNESRTSDWHMDQLTNEMVDLGALPGSEKVENVARFVHTTNPFLDLESLDGKTIEPIIEPSLTGEEVDKINKDLEKIRNDKESVKKALENNLIDSKTAENELKKLEEREAKIYGDVTPKTDSIFNQQLDETDSDDKTKVIAKAVETIAKEDPEKIETLNAFAEWSEKVPTDRAVAEAENYLQELKDSPTVDSKIRKAMAVAIMAMLFGDDFVDALNTGLGVVADDYASEAAIAKETRDAQIALDKKIAEEQRAFKRGNQNSLRDFVESTELARIKEDLKQNSKEKENLSKLKTANSDYIKNTATNLRNQFKEHPDYNAKNFAGRYLPTEVAGMVSVLENQFEKKGKVLDMRDPKMKEAIGVVLNKFIRELNRNPNTPPLSVYADEMFVKRDANKYGDIDPNELAPPLSFFNGHNNMVLLSDGTKLHVRTSVEDFDLAEATKQVSILGETINWLGRAKGDKTSATLGDENAVKLLKKDYIDFRENNKKLFTKMEVMAYNKGWGPFTHFVNVKLAAIPKSLDPNIGTNFDPKLSNASLKTAGFKEKEYDDVKGIAKKIWLETYDKTTGKGTYTYDQIKAELKAKNKN